MLSISLLLFCVSGCLAQVSIPEACPDLETKPNMDVAKYMGVWYEAEKYFSQKEVDGKCIKANYTLNEDGTVRVENSQVSTKTGALNTIKGVARIIDESNKAKVEVEFLIDSKEVKSPYWVLDTDYDSWALAWSCRNVDTKSNRLVWILTRERNPPASVLEKAYSAVEKNKINRELFIKADQTDCPAE